MEDLERQLREVYGADAAFRPGQREAILAVLAGKRTLVVERTGWGKSLVYFLSTQILRRRGYGVTLVISPLLSLMHNQLAAAARFGLRAAAINSENKEAWAGIYRSLQENRLDLLFVAPERLSDETFEQRALRTEKPLGFLVIDEAHCISDWGHDFRPDYLRIRRVLSLLPPNVPLLATTATANDRVIADIERQFGGNLALIRGSLARESLAIAVLPHLQKKEERLAWLKEQVPRLPGTGIIYCLTKADCEMVCRWLQKFGVRAAFYYGQMETEDRRRIEAQFYRNEVKAIVATSALGMGIDKPDLRFVIHFQCPGNPLAYYQQIGRAGRDGKASYAILLAGEEDDEINDYFIRSAFPTPEQYGAVLGVLEAAENGAKRKDILEQVNLTKGKVDQVLKLLEIHGLVTKESSRYYRTVAKWQPEDEEARRVTAEREKEQREMQAFLELEGCYMEHLTRLLDDPEPQPCGVCGNCRKDGRFSLDLPRELVSQASRFLREAPFVIQPRKKWPDGRLIGTGLLLEQGYALSNYADAGYGKLVREDKYRRGCFGEELTSAAVKFLRPRAKQAGITAVTAVPSRRRPNLVPDFARAVAKELALPYIDCLVKTEDTPEQKAQQNSAWQYQNALRGFAVRERVSGNVLLIDDMVDSGWTLTVCGMKLREAGAAKIYPFALANTGKRG